MAPFHKDAGGKHAILQLCIDHAMIKGYKTVILVDAGMYYYNYYSGERRQD